MDDVQGQHKGSTFAEAKRWSDLFKNSAYLVYTAYKAAITSLENMAKDLAKDPCLADRGT